MPKVTRRPLAEADILEIWDYIADDSLTAADRWVDHLDEQFRVLATQPSMGRARDELAPDVRSFPFGRYVISTCRSMTGSMSSGCCTVLATSTQSSIRSSRRTPSRTHSSAPRRSVPAPALQCLTRLADRAVARVRHLTRSSPGSKVS